MGLLSADITKRDDLTVLLMLLDEAGGKQIRTDYWEYDGRWFEVHMERGVATQCVHVKFEPAQSKDLAFTIVVHPADIERYPGLSGALNGEYYATGQTRRNLIEAVAKWMLVKKATQERVRRKREGNS